jgi:hypothetical protein
MKVVVLIVSFIQFHGLNHFHFQSFLSEIDAECGDILYHTEVRWLSCGTMLKCFLVLRLEIETFMKEKVKVMAKLSDKKWL